MNQNVDNKKNKKEKMKKRTKSEDAKFLRRLFANNALYTYIVYVHY